jgi:hypothetical protein
MAVCHAERREASRILTGLETLRSTQRDNAHNLSGFGMRTIFRKFDSDSPVVFSLIHTSCGFVTVIGLVPGIFKEVL